MWNTLLERINPDNQSDGQAGGLDFHNGEFFLGLFVGLIIGVFITLIFKAIFVKCPKNEDENQSDE